MTITVLDNNTVKLLKSSQVITSVSFAVKELVENSLDANAKNIEVNLYDDGLTQIEIKDDGCGIPKEDAPFMALASYTSKIKSFEDLEALHTYGFRGEALQALSQAADVTVSTKTENEEVATLYTLDSNGIITKSEFCHRSVGTTVQVNGLFKRMPVRRQGLLNSRRAKQDLKYLESLLKSFGIIQPPLRITYRRNNQMVFIKPSANSLMESVTNVLGKELASILEMIEETCPEGKIQLLLPKKVLKDESLIFRPGHQYIFVNSRMLTHKELEKLLNKRIQEYFTKGTPSGKKCLFLLNINVDPANLDINLEPNKTKGFLKHEKEIIEFVDKILLYFYELEESREEKNDNQNKNLDSNDNSKCDESDYINESDNINETEKEWPACKKRKVDHNRKSPVEIIVDAPQAKINGDFDREYRIPKRESFEMPIVADVRGPVLSESDSTSEEEMNFYNIKKEKVPSKTVNKSKGDSDESNVHFPPNRMKPSPETETLSQLPVVDLGDDFQSQEIREKENQMLKPKDLIFSSGSESLFAETDMFDDFDFNDISEVSNSSTLKQSTLSLNSSETGELLLEVAKIGPSKEIPKPSAELWSRGHISGIQNGVDVKIPVLKEKELRPNTLTGFNIFFSQVRSQLVKENPEMSVPQIAALLTNRWKEMSAEKKAHYQEIASAKIKQDEMKDLKAKKEKKESEKNKKRLMTMLENMRYKNKSTICKKDETMKMRTTVTVEINKEKVTEKFYRPRSLQENVVIGPLKPSLWIVKVGRQYLLLDVKKMYEKLNFTEHSSDEANAETLESLLQRWMIEVREMSIMHVIGSFEQREDMEDL
ncbi:mismatch repair endonuclease PMS2-like isoform X2 [Belonocnema kinseyi]|nr:mismatch repair endonuclease PMS2-like isoform X2 [Belonocnema kinseyi]